MTELKIKELNKFIKDYEKASNSHDFENVRPFIDGKASYEFTNGSFNGIKEIQEAFEKTFDKIRDETYRISDVKWLFIKDKSAVCKYKFYWKGIIKGKETEGKGKGTNLIIKTSKGLKVIYEHLSK